MTTLDEFYRQDVRDRHEALFPPLDVPTMLDGPDYGTDAWRERHRHNATRLNRLRYACGLHEILPSVGPQRCVFASRCDFANDPNLRCHCRRGYRCPAEAERFVAYVNSARWEFRRSLRWLSVEELDRLVRDLALLDLRKIRISARLRDEGVLRKVRRRRPDGLIEEVLVPTLAERYRVTVDRWSQRIWLRLTSDPN